MKRSDVIEEIMNILEEDTDPKYVDTDFHTIANSILNYLEKSGMIKPWDVNNVSDV